MDSQYTFKINSVQIESESSFFAKFQILEKNPYKPLKTIFTSPLFTWSFMTLTLDPWLFKFFGEFLTTLELLQSQKESKCMALLYLIQP